ncbi:hypothetical protein JAAARDRAFT_662734 [Jaapia argillacea MUCL 33604]|uniref:Uncharacterized protein n=1 Tax=Jaapia argillacea MUCL 33604 TaxID=933084 RepID=A0A067PFG9_9AGAM|nr:hypothetical protein JAAARDRAFT_662734 [Jaapia argillacea MUCL 33604]
MYSAPSGFVLNSYERFSAKRIHGASHPRQSNDVPQLIRVFDGSSTLYEWMPRKVNRLLDPCRFIASPLALGSRNSDTESKLDPGFDLSTMEDVVCDSAVVDVVSPETLL